MKNLIKTTFIAASISLIAACSAPQQIPAVNHPEPIPTPTWPAPNSINYHFADCADIVSENEFNLPGLDDSGDLVMCNPDLTIFYDTTPDSYFDNDTLRVYEDGSVTVMISRQYTEGLDHITVSRLATWCALPSLGCQ